MENIYTRSLADKVSAVNIEITIEITGQQIQSADWDTIPRTLSDISEVLTVKLWLRLHRNGYLL